MPAAHSSFHARSLRQYCWIRTARRARSGRAGCDGGGAEPSRQERKRELRGRKLLARREDLQNARTSQSTPKGLGFHRPSRRLAAIKTRPWRKLGIIGTYCATASGTRKSDLKSESREREKTL